ncbi:MAG TPA: hypothetical protein VLL94_08960, partial [Nitrospiraceae bacterium]|nr:hypothetical protein [Nitrospiraceae bacterium]
MFQVFAYAADEFTELRNAFTRASGIGKLTGFDALSFQYYTTPLTTDTGVKHGYASATGTIGILSGDAKLAATLQNGDWADPSIGGNSIFAAFSKPLGGSTFLGQFTEVVATGFDLMPLAALLDPVTLAPVAALLQRVFNGAALQKYGSSVQVALTGLTQANWPVIFPETSDSWLSTIATPNIDVYQERVDLSKIQLINASAVINFTVFSHVLQPGAAPVAIPGDHPTIISHIIDTGVSATVPVLQFTPAGFDNLRLNCGDMYGALILQDGTRHRTALDGLVFDDATVDTGTGRLQVALVSDLHTAPGEDVALRVSDSMEFSLASAESLLYSRGSNADAVRELMRDYLEWLASFIPDSSADPDLNEIRVRALYLARVARTLAVEGLPVPYLTYSAYSPMVEGAVSLAKQLNTEILDFQRQIGIQRLAELASQNADAINANIKATGSLLTKYFGVAAQNQRDMASFYGQIVDQKQKEFDQSITDIDKLQTLVDDQETATEQAADAFRSAVARFEENEIAKAVFTIATDLFALGTSLALPADAIVAVKALGETFQKVQKVVNILTALSKLITDIKTEVTTLQGISRALANLQSEVELPSSREWQEFLINFDASLATIPTDLAGPKANLSAAFRILALRGQALLEARSKQRQILMDLYNNKRLQDVNNAQANRLGDLTAALHLQDTTAPDPLGVDLIGLTGQVQFQLKQILAMLAKTLVLQDAAVGYELLAAPTPMTRFDLTSLLTVMVQQKSHIVNALSAFNPPPSPVDQPIEYRINAVPAALLTGGGMYEFLIQPSATEFFKYAMVRVQKVTASIEGIASTDSGDYLVNLTCHGNPFEDRDPQRKTLTYNTIERHFGPFDYNIATGQPQFGDQTGSISENFSKITPFSAWKISLPATETNRNIRFTGLTVNIVLRFSVVALLVDVVTRSIAPAHRPRALAAAASSENAVMAVAAGAAAGTAPTKDNRLDQMFQNQAVLTGWDVVLNLMEDPVNKLLAAQHQEKFQDNPMKIDVQFCQGPIDTGNGLIGVFTKFSATLDAPVLHFEQNNHDYVTITQGITAGSITTGSKPVDENYDPLKDCKTDDPAVK